MKILYNISIATAVAVGVLAMSAVIHVVAISIVGITEKIFGEHLGGVVFMAMILVCLIWWVNRGLSIKGGGE